MSCVGDPIEQAVRKRIEHGNLAAADIQQLQRAGLNTCSTLDRAAPHDKHERIRQLVSRIVLKQARCRSPWFSPRSTPR